MVGVTGWLSNGRPLSVLTFKIIMAGGFFNDISPLPQLLAAVVMAITISLLSGKIDEGRVFIPLFTFLPLAISPYYLENWSYKYDSLTMSLSIFLAVIPFLLNGANSFLKKAIFSTFLLFSSLCFYQAALNIFISLSILFFLLNINNGKTLIALEQIKHQAIAYLSANIMYILIIKKFVIYGEYNITHGEIATNNPSLILSTIIRNHHLLGEIFLSAFKGNLWIFFLPLAIIVPAAIIILLKKTLSQDIPFLSKIITLIIVSLCPFLLYIAVYGPMLLLLNPITSARTLLGAAGLICSLFTLSFVLFKKYNKLQFWILLPIFGLFTLAYSLYNAQKTTEKLELSLITRIQSDFSTHNMNDIKNVSILGNAPTSYQSSLSEKNFPIIKFLNVNNIGQDLLWGNVQLNQYYFDKNYLPSETGRSKICTMEKVSSNSIYSIYRNDTLAVIDFSNTKC
ncbi:glucosyltransferase domain-containing protein [Erwinia sp. CGal63]